MVLERGGLRWACLPLKPSAVPHRSHRPRVSRSVQGIPLRPALSCSLFHAGRERRSVDLMLWCREPVVSRAGRSHNFADGLDRAVSMRRVFPARADHPPPPARHLDRSGRVLGCPWGDPGRCGHAFSVRGASGHRGRRRGVSPLPPRAAPVLSRGVAPKRLSRRRFCTFARPIRQPPW
jgi:hypothetical protein